MVRSFHERGQFFFDGFEADFQTGELRKHGQKIPLPEKCSRLLGLLLERPGEMVSRKELHRRLWPTGTHVDFDHNLSNTVARLRHGLADSVQNPEYIETVGSRGYRFIAAVTSEESRHEPSGGKRHRAEKGTIRLAVLPFQNYCPGPCPHWLSDGLTEEVIVRLGDLFSQQLGVIARTSTSKYKGTTKDIGQIGRELNVEYVLEGSVRCMGDQMCVTAQLIQVKDQSHSWAARYEYQLGDMLRIESRVAVRIAQAVGRQLLSTENVTRISDFRPYSRPRIISSRPSGSSSNARARFGGR